MLLEVSLTKGMRKSSFTSCVFVCGAQGPFTYPKCYAANNCQIHYFMFIPAVKKCDWLFLQKQIICFSIDSTKSLITFKSCKSFCQPVPSNAFLSKGRSSVKSYSVKPRYIQLIKYCFAKKEIHLILFYLHKLALQQ